jgi:hypothetical protein
MQLVLEDDEVRELRSLLIAALSELTSEIADTDNAQFSRDLQARRAVLRSVEEKLASAGA